MRFLENILTEHVPGATFHDSILLGTKIDFVKRAAVLDFDINTGVEEGVENSQGSRWIYKRARLRADEIVYFRFPTPPKNVDELKEGLWLDILDINTIAKSVAQELPGFIFKAKHNICFYIFRWNTYFIISAEDVKIEWVK